MLVPQVQALSLVVFEIQRLDPGSAFKDFTSFVENKTKCTKAAQPSETGQDACGPEVAVPGRGGLKP